MHERAEETIKNENNKQTDNVTVVANSVDILRECLQRVSFL
jgi:hypothetical protein